MKEFLEYLIKQIVNHPDDIRVDERIDGTQVFLTINANQEDIGLIIGKKGRTIQSLRDLARTKAIRDGVKVYVEVATDQIQTPQE